MTLTHAALLVLVPAAMALAIGVDLAALLGWLRRRWRRSHG
jgi:hypothetical protein